MTRKKDLHNIARDFSIDEKVVLHKDDVLSVHMAVTKLKNKEESAVLVYKPCGEILADYPNIDKDEFLLSIMTNAQLKLLELYGDNGLLVDSTHGTNKYGFQLTTLMVNDSNHEGFPVAIMYSSKVRQDTFMPFFQAIKERLPQLQPKYFMSDDAPAFYNAFQSIFGDVSKHLLCSWHVRRAWNTKVLQVKNKDVQEKIKQDLEQILHEIDVQTFKVMTENFVKKLCSDYDAKEFANYFITHYMQRTEKWAHCYRIHYGINTNMKLERWHRQLKYEEGQGKVIKRLDKSLSLVLNAVSKKLIGRIISLERGKLTSRIAAIRRRHDTSIQMDPSTVLEIESGKKWTVPSSRVEEITMLLEVYIVTYEKQDCRCDIRCQDCKVCVHTFSCTCYDYCIHFSICKHIHLVCRQYYNKIVIDASSYDSDSSQKDLVISDGNTLHNEEIEVISRELEQSRREKNLEEEKLILKTKFFSLLNECTSLDQLKQIRDNINNLEMQLSAQTAAKQLVAFPSVHNAQPSNSKIVKQRK